MLGGTLSIAESYLQGHWDCDDLTALFRLFIRNLAAADQLDGGLPKLSMAQRVYALAAGQHARRQPQEHSVHYDLGNEFFRLWLDETWAYSSGIFPSPEASLRAASVEKFDARRKLQLESDDHLLEIGTGWGGLALHAAGEHGCRVTTTTISQEQFDVARERVHAAGLADRITLLQQDYRHLSGRFLKLVSIEMVEAVGHRFFDDYFRKCGELLTPDGTMVLQAIVMPERRYQSYLGAVDFIREVRLSRRLSPLDRGDARIDRPYDRLAVRPRGRLCPALRGNVAALAARSPRSARRRAGLGYSERFIRLWDYYLCYCEGPLFEERYVGVVQLQFDKPKCRRDPILRSAERRGDHGDRTWNSRRRRRAAFRLGRELDDGRHARDQRLGNARADARALGRRDTPPRRQHDRLLLGAAFVVVAWVGMALNRPASARVLILVGLTSVWGVRLSLHLWLCKRGNAEDRRYRAMRLPRPAVLVGEPVYRVSAPRLVGVVRRAAVAVRRSDCESCAVGWLDACGVVLG